MVGAEISHHQVDTMEVKTGGRWRFVQHDGNGKEFAFHGVYHEVTPPERIIDTFEFEGLPEKGHVSLETLMLESLAGNRTKLTTIAVFQSVADRDGMAQSGMEKGVNESYDRLDELFAQRNSTVINKRIRFNMEAQTANAHDR